MLPLLLAFQFLTIFPIRISRVVRDEDLVKSMRYYPVVGAVLGILGASVYWLMTRCFSPNVAIVSAVLILILFSGALHLDGFADMCDGFYGQRDRDRILAVMKDSHSGAMAIVGIVCLLAMKIALLSSLDPDNTIRALVIMPTLGRWTMVWLSATSTYARAEGGTGSAYIGHVDRLTLWIATLLSVLIAFLFLQVQGLLMMITAFCGAWLFRRYVQRRIGGMTGDTLGACGEWVEVLTLAVLCFRGTGR
jgi:adenosylcobinamide-GDP ribazoletransferase